MSTFKPREFYYHSCEALASKAERVETPLHYHLRRGDIIAFRKALRTGADALKVDCCGQTPLELLIQQIEDLFVTSLCTSIPVDDLLNTLKREARFPAKFAAQNHQDRTAGLYSEPAKLAYQTLPRGGSPGRPRDPTGKPKKKTLIPPAHPICHNSLPSHAYDPLPPDSLQPTVQRELQYQQSMLVTVEDALNKPISLKIQRRLQNTVNKLDALLELYFELIGCDTMLRTVQQRRMLLFENEGAKSMPRLWLRDLSIPYLYIVLLKLLLELYPRAPDGKAWNPLSPADVRCLMAIVVKLKLNGHELCSFLISTTELLTVFMLSLPGGFVPCSNVTMRYLAHLSFVCDVPKLWVALLDMDPAACLEGPFDWAGTAEEIRLLGCERFGLALFLRPLEDYFDRDIKDAVETTTSV